MELARTLGNPDDDDKSSVTSVATSATESVDSGKIPNVYILIVIEFGISKALETSIVLEYSFDMPSAFPIN